MKHAKHNIFEPVPDEEKKRKGGGGEERKKAKKRGKRTFIIALGSQLKAFQFAYPALGLNLKSS